MMYTRQKILRRQREILVAFLERNEEISNGQCPGAPVAVEHMREKWTALAKQLNAIESGAVKTPDRWKKYWFEWRHKCRKKAAFVTKYMGKMSSKKIIPLNDLEIRVMKLSCGEAHIDIPTSSTNNSFKQDSDDEQNSCAESPNDDVVGKIFNTGTKANEPSNSRTISTPPPQWAIELEERRISSQERMADALQSIASTLRSQEDRRAIIDNKVTDTLSALAESIRDLNNGVQDVLQTIL
ncbi:uncharacterized protein LOC126969140 [Leptidea sinapis]|uniref:uncharacterized protein LOC126969140 n=1 Tax=Leptidea sinapis TaxID=189913 RepID=UPI00212DE763|nr:uncharacterized protein LOC126969140 [Leptidea sinapis]